MCEEFDDFLLVGLFDQKMPMRPPPPPPFRILATPLNSGQEFKQSKHLSKSAGQSSTVESKYCLDMVWLDDIREV